MKPDHQENNFLKQFFQDQKQEEESLTPAFSKVYGKAQIKHRKMKRLKLIIGVAIGLVLLAGIGILTKGTDKNQENIQVAKAGISLYERLIDDGKIITNDILFEFDSANLKPESMTVIKSIVKMMEEHPDVKLSVEGHTDNRGASNYNQELSSARAASVKQALIQLSIDSNRLMARGFGESKPISSNETDQGRMRNRRVEFVSF